MLGMFAATMLKLLFIPVKRPRRCPGYQLTVSKEYPPAAGE